jgi:hypothetical protein
MPATGTSTMTDGPLVRQGERPAPTARRPSRAAIVLALAVLILVAGGVAWWFTLGRAPADDWDRLALVDLAAPAGDAFQPDTPWVRLQFQPGRPGEPNTLHFALGSPSGTPIPAGAAAPRIVSATVQRLVGDVGPAEPLALQPQSDGSFVATTPLDHTSWWRVSVSVAAGQDAAAAVFMLLAPDPNINGPHSVPMPQPAPDAQALYQRGLTDLTALHSIRYTQWIADGRGNAAFSAHAVSAGSEGTPPAFTYRAVGGMEAITIGSTRWIRFPNGLGWQREDGAIVVPPAEWGDEYQGATGFAMGGQEEIDGELCQIVAFVVPETTEPRRQVAAWYLWWVGTKSGQIRQEAMVSRLHYMLHQFSDFDAPMTFLPPTNAATPGATPPAATPAA